MKWIGWLFFSISLLKAAWMDYRTKEVYRFYWWICGACGGALYLKSGQINRNIVDILVFLGLQMWVFRFFYGKADCRAFFVCALTEAAEGMTLLSFFLQMTLAYALLIVVQVRKRNIKSLWRLKEPVAFLPYIAVSWGIVLALEHLYYMH